MPVSTGELAIIGRVLESAASLPETLATLRAQLPHLRWLGCEAADVAEEPFCTYPLVDLHLLDCSSHCVQLVAEPELASGVLLARKGDA